MSFIQTLTALSRPADNDGARVAERLSALFVGARSWIRATRTRFESKLIAFVGVVIVLVVAGFTALVVHQIDQTAQKSSEQHVEQLVQAVTYQLGTMMAGIQQTLRYADDEIREYDTPQKLFELTTGGRVSTHLLRDVLFIDPTGRVVVSGLRPDELKGMSDRSDRDYFRIHLDGSTSDAHIGHPMRGRRTNAEVIPVSYPVRQSDGRLVGVLVALIDVEALERIWVDIGFKPEDRIELIGQDNKVWFSWAGAAAGPAVAGSKSWSRPISGWPMRVVATLDPATVNRESSAPRRAVIASAVAGSTLIGLFCLLLAKRARQAAAGRQAAEALQARLVASLDAVPVEYIEFDSNKRMIHANRAARLSQNWSSDPTGKTMREMKA